MINNQRLETSLPVVGLGKPLHVFSTVGSTNDVAKGLADEGTQHGTLVVADEQTAGRGRGHRKWFSRPGSGLALSLVLRPERVRPADTTLTVLGALAVVEALAKHGLQAQIKWPNDVIVLDGKLAGVLAETSWRGDRMEYAIVGIGVNVHTGSVPLDTLDFPAASIEGAYGLRLEREDLLVDILEKFGLWYKTLGSEAIHEAWRQHLAYCGERVSIRAKGKSMEGTLQGLAEDGRLIIRQKSGQTIIVGEGDLRLRPIDSDPD